MEKLIYSLRWDSPAQPPDIAASVIEAGACRVRINLRDDAVAGGTKLIQSRGRALPDCVVQLWLPSGNPMFRSAADEAVRSFAGSVTAWLVCESTILENPSRSARGERGAGFAQMAFLTLPQTLGWPEWRRIWRDSHTRIAIETQSTFEYRQNLVVESLLEDDGTAPQDIVAIVEECFPIEALTDPLTFFGAAGNPQKFRQNLHSMMESCARFITPGTIDVFPTSQYDFNEE